MPTGLRLSHIPAIKASSSALFSLPAPVVIRSSFVSSPCFIALREEFFLPRGVLGPVDCMAFRRLASIFADEGGSLGADSPALSGCGKLFGSSIVPPPEGGGPMTKFDSAPAVVLCQLGPRECLNLTL